MPTDSHSRTRSVDESLAVLAYLLAERPQRYIRRVVQTVEVDVDTLHTKVSYDLDCDRLKEAAAQQGIFVQGAPAGRSYLFPLAPVTRGDLMDDHDISVDGAGLSILTATESARIASEWIGLLCESLTNVHSWSESDRLELEDVGGILSQIPLLDKNSGRIALVVGRIRLNRLVRTLANTTDAFRPELEQRAKLILRVSEFLTRCYYMTVCIPTSFSGVATIKREVYSYYEDTVGWKPRRLFRHALGLRSPTLVLSVPESFTADSYHFKMKAPRGQHSHAAVAGLATIPADARARSAQVKLEELPTDTVQQSGTRGSAYGHLYIRHSSTTRINFSETSAATSPDFSVQARCNFAEDMPGSILPLLPSALLLSVLLAVLLPGIQTFADPNRTFASAAAAFIVSVPGVVAIWFRQARDIDAVRGPILGTIGPIVTGILALLAAVLLISFQLRSSAEKLLWILVLILSAIWTVYLAAKSCIKVKAEVPNCNGNVPRRVFGNVTI